MKSNEDYDETLINQIKKKSEQIEIPESLEPERMIRRLNKKKKSRNIFVYRIAFSAVLCAFAMSLIYVSPVMKHEVFHSGVAVAGSSVKTASSYAEVMRILRSSNSNTNSFGLIEGSLEDSSATNSASSSKGVDGSTTGGGNNYSDTNIQVEGVDEGDIVKTDGSYIYIADQTETQISIIKANAESSSVVDTINLVETSNKDSFQIQEMYVKDDILSVIITCSYMVEKDNFDSSDSYEISEYKEYTMLKTFNISDRQNPKLEGTVKQDGYYHSSRMVGNIIYLISNYYPYFEFSHMSVESCIPSVNDSQVKPNDIYMADSPQTASYLLITSVDVNKPSDIIAAKAILANCDTIYVSNENIYVADTIWENEEQNSDETEIMKFHYDEQGNIEAVATGRIKGSVLDSFSLDEYNGNLRVVATITTYGEDNSAVFEEVDDSDMKTDIISVSTANTNSLYVLDENLNRIGSIEGLAEDERVYSARFMGDIGYFVTYHQTDPLFAVDLSDPANPKILSELKIPGFSSYLHFWSDNLLLGIGMETGTDGNEGVKLSMFDISDPENVIEVSKYVVDKSWYSPTLYNHKAVLIDSEKNLIGFMVEGEDQVIDAYSSTWKSDYVVFSYDSQNGFELKLRDNLYTNNGTDYMDCSGTRGLYIGDNLYVVNPEQEIKVFGLSDFQLKGVLNLLN